MTGRKSKYKVTVLVSQASRAAAHNNNETFARWSMRKTSIVKSFREDNEFIAYNEDDKDYTNPQDIDTAQTWLDILITYTDQVSVLQGIARDGDCREFNGGIPARKNQQQKIRAFLQSEKATLDALRRKLKEYVRAENIRLKEERRQNKRRDKETHSQRVDRLYEILQADKIFRRLIAADNEIDIIQDVISESNGDYARLLIARLYLAFISIAEMTYSPLMPHEKELIAEVRAHLGIEQEGSSENSL